MKKTLRDKLKLYSLTAGAVAAGTSGQSQVMYTNVDPDTLTSGVNNSYDLDLNNDNVVDFSLSIIESTTSSYFTWSSGFFNYTNMQKGIQIDPVSGNEVLGFWAQALDSGMVVQNAQYGWSGYGGNAIANEVQYFSSYQFTTYYGSTYSGTNSGTWAGGNFVAAQDKYLGLRVNINGNLHYGWARLDVLSDTSFVIKDYAIEMTANKFIITGDTGLAQNASPALSVQAFDLGDEGNGNDLSIKFSQASDENTVGLYRIIMVKDISAPLFTLSDAQSVPSSSYFPIMPNGSANYTQSLYSGMKDSDGDAITVDIAYRAFIHTIANPNAAYNDALSMPSDTVILEKQSLLTAVQAINLSDIDDNGNGLDLEVTFNALDNESNLDEYRVFVVKSQSASLFSLANAEANANYIALSPNGQNQTSVFTSASKDVDGALITNGVPYRAFVLSVADGNIVTTNYLSAASNEVTLDEATGMEEQAAKDLTVAYRSDGVFIQAQNGVVFDRVEVFNLNGAMVFSRQKGIDHLDLLRTEFASGMYMVRFYGLNEPITLKVIVN